MLRRCVEVKQCVIIHSIGKDPKNLPSSLNCKCAALKQTSFQTVIRFLGFSSHTSGVLATKSSELTSNNVLVSDKVHKASDDDGDTTYC